jgi:hypothetical protein
MKLLTLVSGVLAFLLAAAPMALAKDEGYHTHDGFMLRLSAGFAGASATEKGTSIGDVTVSGGGMAQSFAIGGAVADNFILNADIFGVQLSEPEYEIGGTTKTADKTSWTYAAIGPGVTYYIMPMNLYIAGSVGMAVAQMTDEDADETFSSDGGWGMNLMVGKEWWVSTNWGLGVAGQIMYMSIKDKEIIEKKDMTFASFGVLFTATYN